MPHIPPQPSRLAPLGASPPELGKPQDVSFNATANPKTKAALTSRLSIRKFNYDPNKITAQLFGKPLTVNPETGVSNLLSKGT